MSAAEHRAVPDGDYSRPDGTIRCAGCGERVMEAVYTGGWMHAERAAHRFAPFVHADGTLRPDLRCTACGLLGDDPLHA